MGYTGGRASSSVYVHGRRRSVPYALWWRRRGPSGPGLGGGVARHVCMRGLAGRATFQVLARAANGALTSGQGPTCHHARERATACVSTACGANSARSASARRCYASPSTRLLTALRVPFACSLRPRTERAAPAHPDYRLPRKRWWVLNSQCPRGNMFDAGKRTKAGDCTWFASADAFAIARAVREK